MQIGPVATIQDHGLPWGKTLQDEKFALLDGDGLHWGTGYWTRANGELCLLATKGAPKRRARDVHQVVLAPRREHSRKPDEVSARIERLLPGRYLEMRRRAPARDCLELRRRPLDDQPAQGAAFDW